MVPGITAHTLDFMDGEIGFDRVYLILPKEGEVGS